MQTKDVKILLIQIRKSVPIRDYEYQIFLKLSRLSKDQLYSLDVYNEEINNNILDGYDALFIAGSGESVLDEKLSFIAPLENLVKSCHKINLPVLGICFGHQLIAKALGGKIIHDKENEEVGSYNIQLTTESKKDKLFSQMSSNFISQCSHEYRVEQLPENFILLAESEKCPVQAFRVSGKNIYGVQFHIDRGKEEMMVRLNQIDEYENAEHYGVNTADIRNRLRESPEAITLMEKFINTILQ